MNLTGRTFGALKVYAQATKRNRSWCLCNCGSNRSTLTVPNSNLISGLTKHCTAKLHARRGY